MADPTRTQSFTAAPSTAAGGPTATPSAVIPVASSDIPPPPGYELFGEVGHGGMGVVYRARDLELNREVAVKILLPKYAPDSSAARRFTDEAQITGQLQHPGIPPVYRVGGLPDGRPFLAMKLIKGQTLDGLLKEQRPESSRWLGMFEGVCQAVGYAHSHGVIHRDLKPGNIMVGAFGEVQVMDWGLAKLLRISDIGSRNEDAQTTVDHDSIRRDEVRTPHFDRTQPGSVLGTPAYMAPEQAIGAVDQIDRRTDVFGLGAILCALLTGKPPFVGDTAESTRQLAARAKLDDAFDRLDGCGADPDLVALCKRCLSADQISRPADASEVARAVAELRAAADERARRAEIDRERAEVESREQRKRRRVMQWAGTAVAAVLLAGVAGTTVGLIRAEERRKEADLARGREGERADGERVAKEAAILERKRAEQAEADTLEDYRAASDDAMQKLIGSKPRLGRREREYLERTLKRWQAFATRKGDNDQSRIVRAEGHTRTAEVWGKLGRPDEARKEFETACDLLTVLADRFPHVTDCQLGLAQALNSLGTLQRSVGEWEDARKRHVRACELLNGIKDRVGDRREYRLALADAHNNLGVLHAELGETADAKKELRAARDLLKSLADEFADEPEYRLSLARIHNNLGFLRDPQRQGQDARKEYDTARDLLKGLIEKYDDEPEYKQVLGDTFTNRGNLFAELGQWKEARKEFEQARERRKALADEFPAVPEYQSGLAGAHTNLGLLLGVLKDWKAARAELDDARRLLKKLVEQFKTVTEYRVALGGNYCNTAGLIRDEGRPADSLSWYADAIRTITPVHEDEKREVTARRFLGNCYRGRARAYEAMGKHAEAVNDWGRVVDLGPEEDRPTNRAERVRARMNAGQEAEAVAEIDELQKLPVWDANQLCGLATVYSVAASRVVGKKDEYGKRAVALLDRAVQAGFRDLAYLKSDAELDSLRDRDDFKKVIANLEKISVPKK